MPGNGRTRQFPLVFRTPDRQNRRRPLIRRPCERATPNPCLTKEPPIMLRRCVPLALLTLLAISAAAPAVEIKNLRPCYHPVFLSAARTSDKLLQIGRASCRQSVQ